jgi:hypothetical protein
MEQRNGSHPAARSIAKAMPVVLAMWLMTLPLAGVLRKAPLTDLPATSTSMMLLEEEVHPAEVTWQPLISEKESAPDTAVDLPRLGDAWHLSHHGEVPHPPPWS